jgi:hypothetical protein
MFLKERQHPVIQQISGGNRSFCGIELGKGNFGIGIYKCLLVDPADTLECTYIKSILREVAPKNWTSR